MTPPEDVEFFSRITPQALYYMEADALKRKLQSQAGQDLAATGTEKVKNLEGRKKRGPKPKVSPTPSVTTGTTGRNGLSASQSQE